MIWYTHVFERTHKTGDGTRCYRTGPHRAYHFGLHLVENSFQGFEHGWMIWSGWYNLFQGKESNKLYCMTFMGQIRWGIIIYHLIQHWEVIGDLDESISGEVGDGQRWLQGIREKKIVSVVKEKRYLCVYVCFCCEGKGKMGRKVEGEARSRQVWLTFLRCQKY